MTFDKAMRRLMRRSPMTFLNLLGLPAERAELIDATLPDQTVHADAVLRVTEADGNVYLLHIEFQANYDADMVWRLMDYNARLWKIHKVTVVTLLVLLRRRADGSDLTGELTAPHPLTEKPVQNFQYTVLRVWQLPVTQLLTGDLLLLPFAPITDEAMHGNPLAIVDRLGQRLRDDAISDWDARNIAHL